MDVLIKMNPRTLALLLISTSIASIAASETENLELSRKRSLEYSDETDQEGFSTVEPHGATLNENFKEFREMDLDKNINKHKFYEAPRLSLKFNSPPPISKDLLSKKIPRKNTGNSAFGPVIYDEQSILNKAISDKDLNTIRSIMNRSDARELASKIFSNGVNVIHLASHSTEREAIVKILFSALDEIVVTKEMEPMREVAGLIQAYLRDAKECGDIGIIIMLLDKIVELLAKTKVNMEEDDDCQEFKEAALVLIYAYDDIEKIVGNTKTEDKELVKSVKSLLSMNHH